MKIDFPFTKGDYFYYGFGGDTVKRDKVISINAIISEEGEVSFRVDGERVSLNTSEVFDNPQGYFSTYDKLAT